MGLDEWGGRAGGRAGGRMGGERSKVCLCKCIVIKPVHKNDEHTLKGRGW